MVHNFLGSKECESFSIAFLFHSIVLFSLSCIFTFPDRVRELLIISSGIVEEDKIIEEIPIEIFENKFDEEPSKTIENLAIEEVKESSLLVDDIDLTPEIKLTEASDMIINPELLSDNISGVSGSLGSGLSVESSAGGALDRLTIEIIRNAETKDLTVVWLFDASVSLNHQRKQIYERFDNILNELSNAIHVKSINHAICSFGEEIKFLSENPNNNLESLKKSISSVELDESGTENTFNAVGQVCRKYHRPGCRLMIVVFTDEVGDDINLLDSVCNYALTQGTMVYVVGSPAPFGKSSTQFKFVEFDPKYENTERWVEIKQGPETLYDMTLDLHSLPIDDETLDSGFGPYALSKLCSDTGGIFFSVHPNRGDKKNNKKDISPLSSYISRFFDSQVMKSYRPDYRNLAIQNKETIHVTKQALLKACSMPLNISGEQTLRFKAFNEGMFVEELSMAQRFSAKLEPKINEVYNILLLGEPAHQSLKEKRWMASYCLAMGRILSTKCRIESYNYVLAEAKSGLKKKDTKTNIWILLPSKEFTSSNSILRKNYESSQKYLKYVVDNFPDTPWALIANEELNTPIGYTWVEDYEEPPKPSGGNGGNNNRQDDKMKPKLTPKPQRKINKI